MTAGVSAEVTLCKQRDSHARPRRQTLGAAMIVRLGPHKEIGE